MLDKLEIHESSRNDWASIELIYSEAFPDENLLPLVRDLLNDGVVAKSLVATIDARIAGHAIFTNCGVVGNSVDVALLGPLAIAPAWHRQGIGSMLVRDGLQRLAETGAKLVYVLGDPAYYGRLGFLPESLLEPPYPLPAEWKGAWQSQKLGETTRPIAGKLSVPPQWLQPDLWAP